ncbi:YceI family protein [Flavobacterium sp.]|uniref:YceI family protein n=1 Tax=Flavobacterium sp. TaxID=239 RepID=UPI0032647830
MNNKTLIPYLILIIAPFILGCPGPVKEENKNHASANSLSLDAGNEKYGIKTKESVVTWKGGNLMGSNNHVGYVYISKGELIIEKDHLMGGTAEVDMNTIEDENHERDNGLINHLKDPDFFDVKNVPFSTIVLTKAVSINAENWKVAGNLTIKGITNQITFPARIKVNDGIVKLNGRLVIDRTQWDIRYKSGKFYDLLADQTISDSIEFYIKIVAKK